MTHHQHPQTFQLPQGTSDDFTDRYLSVRKTTAGHYVMQNDVEQFKSYVAAFPAVARNAAKFADCYGETLLIICAANGFQQCLDILLSLGADVDAADAAASTSLICAAEKGHVRIVRSLLAAGANVNLVNYKGDTALLVACFKGLSLDVVQLLLAKKADPLARNKNLTTVLYVCVESDGPRATEILKEIIDTLYRSRDLPSQINLGTRDVVSPIHCAAGLGRLAALRLLIQNGADLNARNITRSTPLMAAVEHGAGACAAELLRYDIDPNASDHIGRTPLHFAASQGNLELIDALIKCNRVDVNARDNFGITPLIVACHRLKAAAVMEMIGPNAARGSEFDLFASSTTGTTAVFAVIEKSANNEVLALEILELIRIAMNDDDKFRAEINRMHFGAQLTPLFCACTFGCSLVARRLLHYGADVAAQSRLGVEALFIACQNGHEACVEILLRDGKADPDVRKSDGATALIVAAENNFIRICQILRKYGASMDLRSTHGASPLWIACQMRIKHKTDDLIRFFLACGCNPHTCLTDHASCFFLLAEKNAPRSTFELLLRACNRDEALAKKMINNPMKSTRLTPLMVAVRQNAFDAVEYLLQIGVDVDATDSNGRTAKMFIDVDSDLHELFTAEMTNPQKAKLRWDSYWKYIRELPTKIVSRFCLEENKQDDVVATDPAEIEEKIEKAVSNAKIAVMNKDPLSGVIAKKKIPSVAALCDGLTNEALHSVLLKVNSEEEKESQAKTVAGGGRRRQRE